MATEDIFFILKGRINGEDGTNAEKCDGTMSPDGWYFLLPGDPDGTGPFDSREEAEREFKKIKFPEWSMVNILDALVSGKFTYMECHDWRNYPGAKKGSVIARDWGGYQVLIGPSPSSSRLTVEAVDVHGNSFQLRDGYWDKL